MEVHLLGELQNGSNPGVKIVQKYCTHIVTLIKKKIPHLNATQTKVEKFLIKFYFTQNILNYFFMGRKKAYVYLTKEKRGY